MINVNDWQLDQRWPFRYCVLAWRGPRS